MMNVVAMVLLCLLLAPKAWAGPEEAAECRVLQRAAQTAIEGDSDSYRTRWRNLRTVAEILRDGARRRLGDRDCYGCILRPFAYGVPVSEQRPCGTHDVCSTGDRLYASTDQCVAAVCRRRPECCRWRWDSRCVAAVARICGRACGECAHDTCVEGEALPEDCSPCARQVCDGDPYCCDTAWDAQCVAQAETACGESCSSASTTTTSTTTTTEREPECRADSDCADGNACTAETCNGGVCSAVTVSCDDADPCTIDGCEPARGCTSLPRNCDDGNGCTLDSCSAPGSTAWRDAMERGGVVSTDGCIHSPEPSCRPCRTDAHCEDANECTLDVCEGNVCRRSNLSGACDDGNSCTIGDSCSAGVCVSGRAVDCDDGDECTIDYCDADGECQHNWEGCQIGLRHRP